MWWLVSFYAEVYSASPALLVTDRKMPFSMPHVKRPVTDDKEIATIDRVGVTCDPTTLKSPVRCSVSDPSTCLECKEMEYECKHVSEPFKIRYADGTESAFTVPANATPDEGYCLQLLGKSRRCNQKTGMWLLTRTSLQSRAFFFICKCRYPGIVSQASAYSDCDLCVGCRLESLDVDPLKEGRCLCDPVSEVSEWSPVRGPYCRPKVFREALQDGSLPSDRLTFAKFAAEGKPAEVFNARWLRLYGQALLAREPCTYDVETGRGLPGDNRFLIKRGPKTYAQCFCDASKGNIPVYGSQVGDTGLFKHFTVQEGRIPVGCTSVFRGGGGGEVTKAYERIHYYKRDTRPQVDLVMEVKDPSRLKKRFGGRERLLFRLDWPTNALNALADETPQRTTFETPVLSCRKTYKWGRLTDAFREWDSVTCLRSTDGDCWNEPARDTKDVFVSQDGLYNKPKRWKECPQQMRKRKGLYRCDERHDETPPSKKAKVARDCKKCLYWTSTDLPDIFQAYNVPACLYRNSAYLRMYYSNVIPPPRIAEIGGEKKIPEVEGSDYVLDYTQWHSIRNSLGGAAPILYFDFLTHQVGYATPDRHNVLNLTQREKNIGSVPMDDLTDEKTLAKDEEVNEQAWFT